MMKASLATFEKRIRMAKDSTNERIYNAAITLFHENGYKAATTKLIAERAGVNEVTVFRHFGSKNAIVEEFVQRHIPELERVTDIVGKNATWRLNCIKELFL